MKDEERSMETLKQNPKTDQGLIMHHQSSSVANPFFLFLVKRRTNFSISSLSYSLLQIFRLNNRCIDNEEKTLDCSNIKKFR